MQNMKKNLITWPIYDAHMLCKTVQGKAHHVVELIKSHWTLKYIHGNTSYIYFFMRCDVLSL